MTTALSSASVLDASARTLAGAAADGPVRIPLARLLGRRQGARLPLEVALGVGQRVAQALMVAHERAGGAAVHGRVAAADVHFGRDGSVTLTGFGAPPDGADVLTDVRLLGALLFELCAGLSVAEALGQSKVLRPPSAFNPGIDPSLDELILSTQEEDPAYRPYSVREVETRIREAFDELDLSPSAEALVAQLEQHFPRGESLAAGLAPERGREGKTYAPPAPAAAAEVPQSNAAVGATTEVLAPAGAVAPANAEALGEPAAPAAPQPSDVAPTPSLDARNSTAEPAAPTVASPAPVDAAPQPSDGAPTPSLDTRKSTAEPAGRTTASAAPVAPTPAPLVLAQQRRTSARGLERAETSPTEEARQVARRSAEDERDEEDEAPRYVPPLQRLREKLEALRARGSRRVREEGLEARTRDAEGEERHVSPAASRVRGEGLEARTQDAEGEERHVSPAARVRAQFDQLRRALSRSTHPAGGGKTKRDADEEERYVPPLERLRARLDALKVPEALRSNIALERLRPHLTPRKLSLAGAALLALLWGLRSSPTTVQVSSAPSGALVVFDGESLGVTPLLLKDVTPGRHTVALQKAGFLPEATEVTLERGDQPKVELALLPQPRPAPVTPPAAPSNVRRKGPPARKKWAMTERR